MGLEVFHIGRVRSHPAPGGDDEIALPAQGFERLFFVLTKSGLPFPGENVADGPSELLLDQVIGVHKAKLNMLGDDASDGGLARPHESDQREIVDGAHIVHCLTMVAGTARGGTQFL